MIADGVRHLGHGQVIEDSVQAERNIELAVVVLV